MWRVIVSSMIKSISAGSLLCDVWDSGQTDTQPQTADCVAAVIVCCVAMEWGGGSWICVCHGNGERQELEQLSFLWMLGSFMFQSVTCHSCRGLSPSMKASQEKTLNCNFHFQKACKTVQDLKRPNITAKTRLAMFSIFVIVNKSQEKSGFHPLC